MSNLARTNLTSQQRLDLATLLASESFNAYDFRAIISLFSGMENSYILRGYEITGISGLNVTISVADGLIFNPQDNSGSFYKGLTSDPDLSLTLSANQTTLYIEQVFSTSTEAPVNQAYWNPLAITASTTAGNEFAASSDSQVVLGLTIPTPNTTGFTPGAIPLYKIQTGTNNILSIVDCRPLLFRLGSGGSIPNAANRFNWSPNRTEPVGSGTAAGQSSGSPFQSQDATGILNDKGIKTFKEWMDAVMTRIAEISGSSTWYSNGSSSNYVTGLTLNTAFFDSEAGHSINSMANATFKWNEDFTLSSQGTSPITWQANYAGITWRLGGTFTDGSHRTYSDTKFASSAPVDGGNIYLLLQREVPVASENPVNWAPLTVPTVFVGLNSQVVTGVAGDFTGIAIGDYVRKASESYGRYYRVVAFTSTDSGPAVTDDQTIADSTVIAIKLARAIVGSTSTEPMRYFRSNYSSADVVVDSNSTDVANGNYTRQDINFYWLGRRTGNNLILRDFGSLLPGQEVQGDEEFQAGRGSAAGLVLEHAFLASFTGATGYKLKVGSSTLLTIRRRQRSNEVGNPSDVDNSGSLLTYTMANPGSPLTLNVGDGLWVKLNEAAGGALSAGNVVTSSEDQANADTTTNVYQVLSAANSPLNNLNNKDVFLVARCIATDVLQFFDGSVLSAFGGYTNNSYEFKGDLELDADLYLKTKTTKSILWIDTGGKVAEDNANLFYDQGGSLVGILNYRFGDNTVDIATPADQTWLANLGDHTLTLGSSTSTIKVLGSLLLMGPALTGLTPIIVSEDPTITLGAGNANDGGGGNGLKVADNTLQATSADSVISTNYVDVTYGSSTGYVVGDVVTVTANTSVGGIQAGDLNLVYTIIAGLGTSGTTGQAQIVSATVLRLFTSGTATSSATVTMSPPTVMLQSFLTPSWFEMSDSSGASSGMTSWAFRVKGAAQTVTLTPVVNFGISPTANTTNFIQKRIPYATNDGAGPGGNSTTFDFSANFTWDNAVSKLTVNGTTQTQDLVVNAAQYVNYGTTATVEYTVAATDYVIPVDSTTAGPATAGFGTDDGAAQGQVDTGYEGQTFLATDTGPLVEAQFKLEKEFTPTGCDVVVQLYTAASDLPVTLLATSDPIPVTSMPASGSPAVVTFSFPTKPTITSGSYYAIVLTAANGTMSGGGVSQMGGNPGSYANGQSVSSGDGSSWGALFGGGSDLWFNVNILKLSKIYLPAADASQKGRILHIKDIAGQVTVANKEITIVPDGTDTIDNEASYVMDQPYQSTSVVCDGAGGWFIL